ncbi:glycosyltransferase [Pedobacter psychrodurus]|uniref:Glycosyltransferase n=1 Tax=Pedobacter psychrodurus TaxID=2530456 RepID=A0A4R0PQB9_9SPHI|nr:glycosyltransferase [Pedobacter psychrodurus]TCD23405.1 glycosyltransferase [Pedobacter psychrodurus]
MKTFNFPEISLLITHYNRPESLENLLAKLKDTGCVFGEIVVSDDGSKPIIRERLNQLAQVYGFRLVGTEANRGLGNNLNKGQDAVSKPYTLYLQEDFEPSVLFGEKLASAQGAMDNDTQIDIVKFYAYYAYPYLKPFDDDFDEMFIPRMALDYTKIYFYTDHPHLRRSNFFEKFGKYPEGIKGDTTEYKMCISFIQNKGKGLFYKDFTNLLSQRNSLSEPSTMQRTNWKHRPNILIKVLRDSYRQVKYNIDILTMKRLK